MTRKYDVLSSELIIELKQCVIANKPIDDINQVLLAALLEIERLRGLIFSVDSFNHGICC